MKPLPLLAALLLSSPLAGARSELELLQDRCAEQERQIRQLEEENGRLKSLVSTATATPVARSAKDAAAPALAEKSVVPPASGPTHATVQKGDSLSKVAKRHGTTPETLIRLNQLKNPSLIRPGQKLVLPAKAAPAPAPAARPSTAVGGTHVVRQGETYYSIARKHGIRTEALEAANPSIPATALRPGQRLRLAGGTAPAAAKESTLAKAAPPAAPVARPELPAPATREPASPLDSSTPPPAPLDTASRTVSSAPRIKSVLVTEEIDFGAFAAAHGTTTEKLNALNGHRLKPSTVLAKGSEFYVPAQP
jgi:LysM repeat protein